MITAVKLKNKGGDIKTTAYKKDVYTRFIEWIALTQEERNDIGIPTQRAFAKKYGIAERTPTDWQDRPDFVELKRRQQVRKLALSTSDVLRGLKDRCTRYGMAYDVELYLLYVEGWERKRQLELMGEIKLGNNDLRAVIDLLPVEKRVKFYDTLTELIAEAEAVRGAETA